MSSVKTTTAALALILAAITACSTPNTAPQEVPVPQEPDPTPATLESPAETKEAPPEEGELTLTGRLDIDRLVSGKRFQGTWFHPDGREEPYVLSYRPMRDHLALVDKRVVVRGVPYSNSPDVQHISADHLRLIDVAPAPGEIPRSPTPTSVPPPPFAETRAALEARYGRWVQIRGVVRLARSSAGSGDWKPIDIELKDGARATANVYTTTYTRDWEPRVGKPVTVLGQLGRLRHDTNPDAPFPFIGKPAICDGDAPGCGMASSKPPGKPGLRRKLP